MRNNCNKEVAWLALSVVLLIRIPIVSAQDDVPLLPAATIGIVAPSTWRPFEAAQPSVQNLHTQELDTSKVPALSAPPSPIQPVAAEQLAPLFPSAPTITPVAHFNSGLVAPRPSYFVPPMPYSEPPRPTIPPATEVLCDPAGIRETASAPTEPMRRLELLPNSLLWEPLLANRDEARISFNPSGFESRITRQTVDVSIGQSFGLLRFRPQWSDLLAVQIDGFAVVHARFSEFDFAVSDNFRAGLPITVRYKNWQAKFAYEHISTHLGDETKELFNLRRTEFIKDDAVFGLSYVAANQLRMYGQVGYAFRMFVQDQTASRMRYDVGGEWFNRGNSGPMGQPFAAVNVNFDGAKSNFSPTLSAQVGWMWRKIDRRLGTGRIYAEYYNGRSPYGQFATNREEFAAVGLSLDY